MKRVCVFCGSKAGGNGDYNEAARALGRRLAENGVEVVYGGGSIGLMGALADASLAAGARVIGVIPRHLQEQEPAHAGLTELRVVETMHERKALMAGLADGFVALPGGFGTLEETLEAITWAQLGVHDKPIGLLNVGGYFDPLLALIRHAVEEGFISEEHTGLFLSGADPARLLARMADFRPLAKPRGWMKTRDV